MWRAGRSQHRKRLRSEGGSLKATSPPPAGHGTRVMPAAEDTARHLLRGTAAKDDRGISVHDPTVLLPHPTPAFAQHMIWDPPPSQQGNLLTSLPDFTCFMSQRSKTGGKRNSGPWDGFLWEGQLGGQSSPRTELSVPSTHRGNKRNAPDLKFLCKHPESFSSLHHPDIFLSKRDSRAVRVLFLITQTLPIESFINGQRKMSVLK